MALTNTQRDQVIASAERLNIPWDLALGLVDKESAGRATYNVNGLQLPAIRIEGHIFYRRLEAYDKKLGTKLLAKAVAAGLADKKVGGVKNSTNMAGRYAQFKRMEEINKDIATESISIGIGQVMGFNYKAAGHSSAVEMLQAATTGFQAQVDQFLNFIASSEKGLAAAQAYNYEGLAAFYNGSGWRSINPSYARDLKRFTEQWADAAGQNVQVDPNWPARIEALGFPDVKSFQRERGLRVDGIVGPITRQAVLDAEKAKRDAGKKGQGGAIAAAGGGVVAAGGAVAVESGAVESIGQQIEQNKYIIDVLQGAAGLGTTVVLVVAAGLIGLAAFILIRNWMNKRGAV